MELREYAKTHPFAGTQYADNICAFSTERYVNPNPSPNPNPNICAFSTERYAPQPTQRWIAAATQRWIDIRTLLPEPEPEP